MPVFKATRPDTMLPVGWLYLGLGLILPIMIYNALLIWARFTDMGCLVLLGLFLLGGLGIAAWISIQLQLTSIWRSMPAFLLFILAPPTVATFLLFEWAADILPLLPQQEEGHRNALALIMGFYSGYPKPVQRIIKGRVKTLVKGSTLGGLGPGWLMTEPDNAVVLKGRTEIRRIVGPGGIFTQADEVPYEILDLRQQIRKMELQAITRDGIKVNLQVSIVFQIQPGHHTLHFGRPWPYTRDAAWRIVFAAEVNPKGRTPLDAHLSHPWSDIPLEVAQSIIQQTIINYTLDELYGAHDQTIPPRQAISEHTRARLAEQLEPKGFHIASCAIGIITPVDPAVTEQRIRTWKARWVRQLVTWQGAAQARRFEHFATIQNRARIDLLSRFIEATHAAIQQSEQNTAWNLVAYNLLENMERLAQEPEIQNYLPETALPALEELRRRVTQEEEHE